MSSPPGLKDHLLSPQEIEAMGTFPSPQIESTQQKQQLLLPDGEKQEKKFIRKLPSGKRDDVVSDGGNRVVLHCSTTSTLTRHTCVHGWE